MYCSVCCCILQWCCQFDRRRVPIIGSGLLFKYIVTKIVIYFGTCLFQGHLRTIFVSNNFLFFGIITKGIVIEVTVCFFTVHFWSNFYQWWCCCRHRCWHFCWCCCRLRWCCCRLRWRCRCCWCCWCCRLCWRWCSRSHWSCRFRCVFFHFNFAF